MSYNKSKLYVVICFHFSIFEPLETAKKAVGDAAKAL